MIRRQQFRLQIFDHFVLRLFKWHAHYFLSNSVVYAFKCHQGHEFRLHVCRALHDIAVEGLQSAKNTVESEGRHSNMKQFELFSAIGSALGLQSPRLDFTDTIPMLSSLADFFPSQRDLFDECKEHGQVKS